ncbi:galactokinase [Parashewanella spongiae]|nr:galactokinase [Parashewanella spongiae]MCL1076762.1 galactokinase [Parashewanella spongiae]
MLFKQSFHEKFNLAATLICHAPGRVNIIGDHTDYNDGFVLPAAINFGTDIAASRREDDYVKVIALDCNQEFVEFSIEDIQFDERYSWSNYVRGVLQVLKQAFPQIRGANLLVSGNVPQGAGLSSSASFEVAVLKTFSELYQLPLDGIKAALMGQSAENNFVGCNCGIMDQLISAMGKQGNAMLLDCRSLTFEDAPIPEGIGLFIVNSNVKRGLVDSEYNLRREQCEQVAAYFKKSALRDVSLSELEAAESMLDPVLFRRARHVVTENLRTEAALACFKNADMAGLGQLMRESHESLKSDFEVTTKELDGLADMLNEVLGDSGGARMTGGGFGGCVVALSPINQLHVLQKTIDELYSKIFGLSADTYVCSIEQGAFRVI